MTEKLKQTIEEEIMESPKEIQDAINAFDWIKATEEVSKKYSLDENELENFQLETLLVLVGATDPEFYAINIENQVETTKDEAENIAKETFQKIFNPINNLLIENIKKNIKNTSWQQNLDFVLSGGNYSAFLSEKNNSDISPESSKTTTLNNSKKIEDIKNKFII